MARNERAETGEGATSSIAARLKWTSIATIVVGLSNTRWWLKVCACRNLGARANETRSPGDLGQMEMEHQNMNEMLTREWGKPPEEASIKAPMKQAKINPRWMRLIMLHAPPLLEHTLKTTDDGPSPSPSRRRYSQIGSPKIASVRIEDRAESTLEPLCMLDDADGCGWAACGDVEAAVAVGVCVCVCLAGNPGGWICSWRSPGARLRAYDGYLTLPVPSTSRSELGFVPVSYLFILFSSSSSSSSFIESSSFIPSCHPNIQSHPLRDSPPSHVPSSAILVVFCTAQSASTRRAIRIALIHSPARFLLSCVPLVDPQRALSAISDVTSARRPPIAIRHHSRQTPNCNRLSNNLSSCCRAMSEQPQPQGRSRSNSLQRMLELEKKLLLQRTQSNTANRSHPPISPVFTDGSLPTTPTSQARRFELSPRKETRRSTTLPTRPSSAVPPPLVINTASRGDPPAMIHRKEVGSEASRPRDASRDYSIPAMTLDKSAHKTVAFMFPPEVEEQRSVCQSPSWEAYDRRKKEKKEEKKEKEQALKEAKTRGRKLSKAPPPPSPSSAPTLGARSMSEVMAPTRQLKQKPRPSSVLGIPIPIAKKVEEPEPTKRRRSSSLTSVIRQSFEIRRASFDRKRDPGFIGGIKLEKQNQEFHQKVLDDQAKGNSKVHPALRKSFLGHGSFTPLKAPLDSSHGEQPEGKRRAYPPISIQAASARNPSLLTPTSPARPDFTNIYLWSARAGQASDECAVADEQEDQGGLNDKSLPLPPVEQPRQRKENGLTRKGGVYLKTTPPMAHLPKFEAAKRSNEELRPANADEQEQSKPALGAEPGVSHNPTHIAYAQTKSSKDKDKSAGIRSAMKGRIRSESNASTISVAPVPPRKSSKRNSMLLLSRSHASTDKDEVTSPQDFFGSFKYPYTPPKLELKTHMDTVKPSCEKRVTPSSPPSIPYEKTSPGARPTPFSSESWSASNAKWNLKGAAMAAFSRGNLSHSSSRRPSTAGNYEKGSGPPPTAQLLQGNKMRSPSLADIQASHGHSVSASLSAIPKTHRMLGDDHDSSTPQSPMTWGPRTSSSEEDSYSDALQSASPPSTPNTSPPQSETGHHPPSVSLAKKHVVSSDEERPTHYKHQPSNSWSPGISPPFLKNEGYQPSVSSKCGSDTDDEHMQRAVRKVMESFPDVAVGHSRRYRNRDEARLPSNLKYQATRPGERTRNVNPSTSPERRADDDIHNAYRTYQAEVTHQDVPKTAPLRTPSNPQSPTAWSPRGHRSSASVPEVGTKPFRKPISSSLNNQPGEPIAKMFVECCSCRYYHDMPSKLYEAMANPDGVLSSSEKVGFVGKVSMTVSCPWCKHEMSTKCCAGFAAMVYIKERLH
ncbi:hypothetical protein G7046_g9930 [Stylonectria norvegica]|nr:hypothetical protein G7046_g9930 [Stylonectria norvegica]